MAPIQRDAINVFDLVLVCFQIAVKTATEERVRLRKFILIITEFISTLPLLADAFQPPVRIAHLARFPL
jgi:hypothetical protein